MSFGHPNVETLPVYNEMCRKLLFNKLSIVCNIKILLMTFCQEGPQMCVQSFMRIGEIAWEEDKIFWMCDKVYWTYKLKCTILDFSAT